MRQQGDVLSLQQVPNLRLPAGRLVLTPIGTHDILVRYPGLARYRSQVFFFRLIVDLQTFEEFDRSSSRTPPAVASSVPANQEVKNSEGSTHAIRNVQSIAIAQKFASQGRSPLRVSRPTCNCDWDTQGAQLVQHVVNTLVESRLHNFGRNQGFEYANRLLWIDLEAGEKSERGFRAALGN